MTVFALVNELKCYGDSFEVIIIIDGKERDIALVTDKTATGVVYLEAL